MYPVDAARLLEAAEPLKKFFRIFVRVLPGHDREPGAQFIHTQWTRRCPRKVADLALENPSIRACEHRAGHPVGMALAAIAHHVDLGAELPDRLVVEFGGIEACRV